MPETLKRLTLGLLLIAFAAGVLLYTDRKARNPRRPNAGRLNQGEQVKRVAIVQHASLSVLEEGANGVIEALDARGHSHGHRLDIRRFNAEADLGTANAIAREVTSGSFDLIITISTPSLQTVANANKSGMRTPHVFGLVTDPYAAGVGIDREDHLKHPPYMTGFGSMQPVESAFRMARRMRPELKTVGLVWNSSESNSLAQTTVARKLCAEMGITLLEANAENSSSALESANSLISRGIEALWLSGDITVSLASETIINAAKRAGIPAFSSIPPNIKFGGLFDLGANYTEVGRSVGALAADVLDGRDPATIPVENNVPELFLFNDTILDSLNDRWTIPDDVRTKADGWITATSTKLPTATKLPTSPALPRPQVGRTYRIAIAGFAPDPAADRCIQGVLDGMRALGFEEGKNLEVRRTHAQAEIASIPQMLQTVDASDVDAIVAMSTPVISGACGLVKQKPVVFTFCSDPIAAGAGQSFTQHLPHMTGIGSFPPVEEMVDAIRQSLPDARSIGTIYNASEANSVKVMEVARPVFKKSGLALEEVTVSTPADVFPAAQALVSRGVQAFYISGDNTVVQGLDAVLKITRDARLPLFVDDPDAAKRGALACIGLGFYKPGYDTALPLARVLLGESPGVIPIKNVAEKTVWLNMPLATTLGVQFPPALLKEFENSTAAAAAAAATPPVPAAPTPATPATPDAPAPAKPLAPPPSASGRKMNLDLIEYLETPNVEINREGILDGLAQAGWVRGRDFELRIRNAQGDMSNLNLIIDAAISEDSDLLLPSTTPALQATLRRAQGRPAVFSLVANPIIAGAGRSDTEHLPFVTGAYLPAPHEEGLTALRECMPDVKRIGTLFAPSEINSVFYKDHLLSVAKSMGIEVEIIGVSTSGEVAEAALALSSRGVQAICQISDNLTGASFASIAQVARRARLPLMGFASGQADNGAMLTVSRDFHDGGIASAQLAVRVLNGESPATIPFQLVDKIRYRFNPAAATSVAITIPPRLLSKGDIVP